MLPQKTFTCSLDGKIMTELVSCLYCLTHNFDSNDSEYNIESRYLLLECKDCGNVITMNKKKVRFDNGFWVVKR